MGRLIAAVLTAGWIVAGCGVFTGDRFATNDELRGPWRAEPMSVDPPTIAAGEVECQVRGELIRGDDAPAADRLVTVDARGGSRLTLLFVGRGEDSMACELRMDATGKLSMVGGSASTVAGPGEFRAPNEVAIVSSGQMSGIGAGEWSSVTGRTGSAVTVVRVVFADGSALRASVGGGWFTAWWPTTQTNFVVEGFDASGQKVGEAEQ